MRLTTTFVAMAVLTACGCEGRERRELERQKERLEARHVALVAQANALTAGRDPATYTDAEKAALAPVAASIYRAIVDTQNELAAVRAELATLYAE